MDKQDAEHEHRPSHAGTAQLTDVDVAALERAPAGHEEQHARQQPGSDCESGARVERGGEQCDDGGDRHDAGGQPPQERPQGVGACAEREHRDRTQPGRERGAGTGDGKEHELAHGFSVRAQRSADIRDIALSGRGELLSRCGGSPRWRPAS